MNLGSCLLPHIKTGLNKLFGARYTKIIFMLLTVLLGMGFLLAQILKLFPKDCHAAI